MILRFAYARLKKSGRYVDTCKSAGCRAAWSIISCPEKKIVQKKKFFFDQ